MVGIGVSLWSLFTLEYHLDTHHGSLNTLEDPYLCSVIDIRKGLYSLETLCFISYLLISI